ncbi:MAG: septum site determining protein [Actinomycetota bacterium]|nr:septum site determining protein [Actinomycetota bacterium]
MTRALTTATALLLTREEDLLEGSLRLAAAAGVMLDVAHDIPTALRGWSSAPVVLVGADMLSELSVTCPVRRGQVLVISTTSPPDGLFREALDIGAAHVAELPAAETWLVELLTDVADGDGSGAVTVAVVGGSGGAGASTFAAALAQLAASSAHPAVLLDADPLGSGIDRIVGFEELPGIRWESLVESAGRFSSRSLREALPQRNGLAALTWGPGPRHQVDAFTVREVLSAAQRGSELVVVDLPRYPDAVAAEVLPRCDHVLLLATLTVPAVVASSRVAAHLVETGRTVHLLTRGRRSVLDPEDVARTLTLPLLASMSDQRHLAEWIDLGLGPVHSRRGPLARAASSVLQRVGAPAGQVA